MTGVYQANKGRQAFAGAPRPVAGTSAKTCSWLIAGASTKATNDMFVDVPNHRSRRLWESSP
jgi:hypothetical protein